MKYIFIIHVLISFGFCTSQDTNDTRCSIYDGECQKQYFQRIAGQYAYTGIADAGIPVIDPFSLSNVILSIFGGLVKLTLVSGEAIGIGKCTVTKFETNVPARYRQPEMICSNITVKGFFKLVTAPKVANSCPWCNIHGEGNGTIVFEDWFFKFRYPFKMVRRADGKIYLDALFDQAEYEASVKKVSVTADCIKMGKYDITDNVVCFLNKYWEPIMDSHVGKFINDKSAQYYYEIYKAFFDTAPADTFLNDDLELLLDD